MRRRRTIPLLCAALLLAAASSPNPAFGSGKVVVQLAWKHQFQFAGYYAALDQGYYREAGLDVTLAEGGEGTFAREEVLSGRAQYGVAGAELLLHRAGGDPFVVLAAIFQHSASILLTRADAGIHHPQDLIGGRVMLLPGNKDADILAIFQNEGIPLNRIHRLDQTYNLDDLIQGRTDAVSAYITNEPWHLRRAGVEPGIIRPQTYGVDFYSDCLFTTEAEIEKRPERVEVFLEASLRGWDYAMAHPEEIIDLLIHRYGVRKRRDHLRYEARAMEELIFPRLVEMGHMNPGRWRHIADTFFRLGALPEDFDLTGFLHDPNPGPDVRKLKIALLVLGAGLMGASLFLLLFVRMNRRLKKEVAERKRTEASLRESETRLRTIFETSRAGIILVSARGVITFANQCMAEMVGRPLAELIGSAYPEHVHPDQRDAGNENMKRLIDGEIDSVALERRYIRKDGTDFWGFLTGKRHEDAAGNLVSLVGIIADITERVKLEQELRQAHKMESIGTLTGGVAHDFNNILGAILGNTELALLDLPEWTPAHARLKAVQSAGLKAAGIVKQLLNFSRKTVQEMAPIGALAVIRDALGFLRSTIPATIDIRQRLPEKEVTILADPVQINQVLLNLCTNAAQAMEETGGALEVEVRRVSLTAESAAGYPGLRAGDHLRIVIRDTGPGIDPGIAERIFDPYFTTKAVGKGSGMGLAVVLGIVRNHGGAIAVDGHPGKGAVFTILFPVIDREIADAAAAGEIQTGTERILFVDDETTVTDVIGQLLSALGYRVETHCEPLKALERFRLDPHGYDLVITDMTMPGMTGVQLFFKLKEIRKEIPVIVCTGHSALIDEAKSEEIGVAAFLMKPILREEIAGVIRGVLDREGEGANENGPRCAARER